MTKKYVYGCIMYYILLNQKKNSTYRSILNQSCASERKTFWKREFLSVQTEFEYKPYIHGFQIKQTKRIEYKRWLKRRNESRKTKKSDNNDWGRWELRFRRLWTDFTYKSHIDSFENKRNTQIEEWRGWEKVKKAKNGAKQLYYILS